MQRSRVARKLFKCVMNPAVYWLCRCPFRKRALKIKRQLVPHWMLMTFCDFTKDWKTFRPTTFRNMQEGVVRNACRLIMIPAATLKALESSKESLRFHTCQISYVWKITCEFTCFYHMFQFSRNMWNFNPTCEITCLLSHVQSWFYFVT